MVRWLFLWCPEFFNRSCHVKLIIWGNLSCSIGIKNVPLVFSLRVYYRVFWGMIKSDWNLFNCSFQLGTWSTLFTSFIHADKHRSWPSMPGWCNYMGKKIIPGETVFLLSLVFLMKKDFKSYNHIISFFFQT